MYKSEIFNIQVLFSFFEYLITIVNTQHTHTNLIKKYSDEQIKIIKTIRYSLLYPKKNIIEVKTNLRIYLLSFLWSHIKFIYIHSLSLKLVVSPISKLLKKNLRNGGS